MPPPGTTPSVSGRPLGYDAPGAPIYSQSDEAPYILGRAITLPATASGPKTNWASGQTSPSTCRSARRS